METVDQLLKGCSLYYFDLSTGTSLVCSMNDIPPYLFLSREGDNDVRDIGKHDFRSVLLHTIVSNVNRRGVP